MVTPLNIWCNAHFPADAVHLLEQGTVGHHLLWSNQRHASNLSAGGPDTQLAEADIAFGQPDPASLLAAPKLRWAQLTTAGYTRYDNPDFRAAAKKKHLILTSSSTVYAEPCAQHLAAFFYSHARSLFPAARVQINQRSWNGDLRPQCQLLDDQRVLIYGFGAIATRLVELLAPLELDIIGVRRNPTGDEPIKTVTIDEADALLGQADIIVNVLPANDSSERFFDAARIARFKRGVVFMNIGRGKTVEQDALQRALATGDVAAAYLDVTDPEPLPDNHPLWSIPTCQITPHAAGGFTGEPETLVHHFLTNLRNFEHKRKMRDRVM